MKAIDLLCEGVMRYAASKVVGQGRGKVVAIDSLVEDIRETIKDRLDEVLGEWKDAVDSALNTDAFLSRLLEAEALELALEAIRRHDARLSYVFNLATQEWQLFTCGKREAVLAAYAQSRKDWNTWTYEERYGSLVQETERTYLIGDFSTTKI